MTNQSANSNLSFNHFALIAGVAVTLLGFSWMKNPEIFSRLFSKAAPSKIEDQARVAYYPYVAKENSEPTVAGASTQAAGPSILNEDGSLSPVFDFGSVLGVNTEQISADAESIKVITVADSPAGIEDFIKSSQKVESELINVVSFEQALSSQDQQQINHEADKLSQVLVSLKTTPVPASFARLQKLKILQYQVAIQMLKNYTSVDNNPEQALNDLGVFMESQKMMGDELVRLNQQYNLEAR